MNKRVLASLTATGLVAGTALTVVAALSAKGDHTRVLLPLGAGASGAQLAASRDAAPTGGLAEGDSKMMAPYFRQEYVLGAELPALDGPSTVWKLTRSDVDAATLSHLAEVFGVAGDPVKVGEAPWQQWLIGPQDYSTANLTVDLAAGSRWWFNDPSAYGRPVACAVATTEPAPAPDQKPDAGAVPPADSAVSVDGSGTDVLIDPAVECKAPEPLANVPSKDEAIAIAKKLADKVGVDGLDLVWTADSGEWGANAYAQLRLGDAVTDEQWFSVGFAGNATISYAGGLLGKPVRVDNYPRVGTAAAFQQLKDGTAWGYGGPMLMAEARGIAVGEPAPTGADTSSAGGSSAGSVGICQEGVDSPCNGPVEMTPPISEPMPAPEMVTVTITGVTETLQTIYGSDNEIYLVPSYRFTDSQGSWYPVVAIEQSFIAPPVEPTPAVPGTETPMPTPSVAVDTTVIPETVPPVAETTVAG